MAGLSAKLGLNFGGGQSSTMTSGTPGYGMGTDASDHVTLLVLVVAELLLVGWLRFSFKKHFGG